MSFSHLQVLNDIPAVGQDGPHGAVVTAVRHDSANKGVVRVGDRVISVQGIKIENGQTQAAELLLSEAHGNAKAEVECVIARPAQVGQ